MSADIPDPAAVAARVRAALAYAAIEVKTSVPGISPATMARIVSPSSPRGVRSEQELKRVADATDVPLWFLLHGFSAEHVEPDVAERLEAMQHQISTQARTLERLQEVVKARAVLLEEYARDMDALRARLGATPPDPGAAVEQETAAPLPQPSPSRSPSNGPAGPAR